MPLYSLHFSEFDSIKDVYQKYFKVLPDYEAPQIVARSTATV